MKDAGAIAFSRRPAFLKHKRYRWVIHCFVYRDRDSRDDVEIMLEKVVGHLSNVFLSSPSTTFEYRVRFRTYVRLISSRVPVSPAFATVVS